MIMVRMMEILVMITTTIPITIVDAVVVVIDTIGYYLKYIILL